MCSQRPPGGPLALVLLEVVLLSSCGDSQLPEVSWEGDKIKFATTQENLPCGGTLETLDDRVKELESELSQPLPSGKKITYYYLPGEMDLSPCPSSATGCADGLTVYSKLPIHTHELVHSVLSPLGPKHPFIEEGLAVLYSHEGFCPGIYGSILEVESDVIESLVPNINRSSFSHLLAGAFSRFIAIEFGDDALKHIYTQLSRIADEKEYDSAISKETGLSLETVLALFSSSMMSDDYNGCFASYVECASSAISLPQTTDTWEYHIDMGCSSEVVTGPYYENIDYITPYLSNIHVLQIQEDGGLYAMSVGKSENWRAIVLIGYCGEPGWLLELDLSKDQTGEDDAIEIAEGEYEVTIINYSEYDFYDTDAPEQTLDLLFESIY